MRKLLILFFAFLYSFHAPAHANPYLMDYETFVHLEAEQKDEIVKNFMKLVVEIEAKFQHDQKVGTYSPERHREFKRLVNKFFELLVSSSYAQTPAPAAAVKDQNFATFSQQFKNFLDPNAKTFNQDKCIYAGWVSKIVKGYCVHPAADVLTTLDRRGKPVNDPVKAAYLANSLDPKKKKSACAATEITCNPVVFGYAKADEKAPFCVNISFKSAEENNAHNAAYDCMRYALREGLDPVKDKAVYDKIMKNSDDPSKRLDYLRKQMESGVNRDAFNTIHGYLFDSCICQGEDSKTAISNKYRDYMRPHRTCFGLMNSMREIHKGCPVPKDDMFPAFAPLNDFYRTQWTQTYDIKNFKPAKKEDKVGDTFGTAYADLVTPKEFRDKYCPYIKPESCTATCGEEKIVNGKSEWECTISSYMSNQDKIELNPPLKVPVTDVATKKIEVPGKPGLFCPIEVKKKELPETCSIECSADKDASGKATGKLKCKVTDATKIIEWKKDKDWKDEFPLEEKDIKEGKYTINKVACTVTKLADNACSIAVSADEKGEVLTAVIGFPNDPKGKDLEVAWPEGFTPDATDKHKATLKWDGKAVVLKFSDKDKKYNCVHDQPAKPEDDEAVTCSLKHEENGDNFLVTMTVTGGDVVEPGWDPKSPVNDDDKDGTQAKYPVKDWKDKEIAAKPKVKKKKDGKEEVIDCGKVKLTSTKGPKDYSISAKGNGTTDVNKKVTVFSITTPDGQTLTSPPAGYEIRWVRGAADDLEFKAAKDTEEVTEKKDESMPADEQEVEMKEESKVEPKEEDKRPDAEPKDSKKFAGGGKDLNADRKKEHSYYVIAQLVEKATGKVVAQSERIKIPKQDAPYTPANVQRPQPMMRQKIDTWTLEKR